MSLTITNTMSHARSFLKAESTYASTEEVRMANSIQSIVASYHRWHWNSQDGQDIGLSLGVQDYTVNTADQNKMLYIQGAYLTTPSQTFADLITDSNYIVPVTQESGRPIAVSILSPVKVRFWPNPNATYTFHWRYHKRPSIFVRNTESWDLPEAFADVVKIGMIWQVMSFADDERSDTYQKTFYQLLDAQKAHERITMGRMR